MSSEARGIFLSDLILQTGIQDGLRQLRRDPTLVDHCFRSLRDDVLTQKVYGENVAAQAKAWFLKTNVEVVIANGLNLPPPPIISIQLTGGGENEDTFADLHYQSSDPVDAPQWESLVGPFDPESYDPVTGILVLPETVTAKLVVVEGMIVVTKTGRQLEIQTAAGAAVGLGPNTVADLAGATIRGARPTQAVALESVKEDESWRVGVHVNGEPTYLTWLFAILKYVLYRGREDLESRGLERVKLSFAEPQDASYDSQPAYQRFMTVRGSVTQVWVKARHGRVYSVNQEIDAVKTIGAEATAPLADWGWSVET